MNKSLKVGIVANEFFDENIGRMGGFGWAAKRAADVLSNHPSCNVEVSYLTSNNLALPSQEKVILDGIPLISVDGTRYQKLLKMFKIKIDILLTIDYRSNYNNVFNVLPFTPIITWVRDPRTQDDVHKVNSLKIPGKKVEPAGIKEVETHGLESFIKRTFSLSTNVTLANKMPHMKKTNKEVYNLQESDWVLPNPSVVNYSKVLVKKEKKERLSLSVDWTRSNGHGYFLNWQGRFLRLIS